MAPLTSATSSSCRSWRSSEMAAVANPPGSRAFPRGDVLVIAQGADLVFLDGATGEERVRHPALGPPSIYPRIVSDDAHVVVALDPFVRAYDLRGALGLR